MAYLKKITVLKWIVYSLITFNSLIMYMDINENYTIRILGSVFCPAFGSNWRCEILSMVGIYGFFCGLILLMTGVIGTKKKTKLLNNLNKTESISCFFHTIVFIFFLGHSMSWRRAGRRRRRRRRRRCLRSTTAPSRRRRRRRSTARRSRCWTARSSRPTARGPRAAGPR